MKRVLGKTLFLVAALALVASEPARAQVKRNGSWSAATNTGQTMIGFWTADLDSTGMIATGTWTLTDARGVTRASGGWSAGKVRNGWNGEWRARVVGRQAELSGTWTADLSSRPTAPLDFLFTTAIRAAVIGDWQFGQQSGAWSIRTFR